MPRNPFPVIPFAGTGAKGTLQPTTNQAYQGNPSKQTLLAIMPRIRWGQMFTKASMTLQNAGPMPHRVYRPHNESQTGQQPNLPYSTADWGCRLIEIQGSWVESVYMDKIRVAPDKTCGFSSRASSSPTSADPRDSGRSKEKLTERLIPRSCGPACEAEGEPGLDLPDLRLEPWAPNWKVSELLPCGFQAASQPFDQLATNFPEPTWHMLGTLAMVGWPAYGVEMRGPESWARPPALSFCRVRRVHGSNVGRVLSWGKKAGFWGKNGICSEGSPSQGDC